MKLERTLRNFLLSLDTSALRHSEDEDEDEELELVCRGELVSL